MAQQAATETRKRTFMDVPTAARLAGFSIRHFRRIIEEDEIPIMQIGRKFFIVAARFENGRPTQARNGPAPVYKIDRRKSRLSTKLMRSRARPATEGGARPVQQQASKEIAAYELEGAAGGQPHSFTPEFLQ